ncbi:MAG: DUF6873 family GME fold protein, partial [Spirochaetota bacterium]
SYGFDILVLPRCCSVHPALSGHADISLAQIGNTVVVRPDMPACFVSELSSRTTVVHGETLLAETYPADVAYNIAPAPGCYFHRTDLTDPVVASVCAARRLEAVDVRQGYSGCSVITLPDGSIITSDTPIARRAEEKGIDVLRVSPAGIELPGFSHGLIGGSAGCYGSTLYITGDFSHHEDAERICGFTGARGIRISRLTPKPVFDVGTLFFV